MRVRHFLKENGGYLFALALVGAFLYAFNLHDPLFWDDADWIVNNPSVHALTWSNVTFIFSHNVLGGIGGVSNYYRPFLFLTFLANYLVSGASPAMYHFVSNGIHIANAILVFYLLKRWLGDRRPAFIAALLFLIHPLQTEAVTYVSGRGDPLSIFFMLAGIALYVTGRRWWAGAAAVLAILSRETAVLFPAYLGVALIAFEHRDAFWVRFKKAFIQTLPYIAISVIYGIMRLTVLNFENTLNFYRQQNIYSAHLSYRIYTFFHALLTYLHLTVWPIRLHMDRDIPVSVSIWDGWSWLGASVILGLLGLLAVLYRKNKTAQFNLWFFGTGIFFLNLLPTSGIVPINARIYEHWLYFSLFGFFAVAGFYIDRTWRWLIARHRALIPLAAAIFVAYCVFLGIQTIRRNLLWGDMKNFYLNILYYEPKDVRILNNLGNWYSDNQDDVSAIPYFIKAIDADSTQPAPYYNLGNIASTHAQWSQAEVLYKKAIAADPAFHYAYGNLAVAYLYENKPAEALATLEELEKIYPTENTEQNIAALKKAIEIKK